MTVWHGPQIDAAICEHAPLVKRLARNMALRLPTSIDVRDLIQAGMIGLLDAATRFDSDQGAPFQGFAIPRIRGAMIDELRNADWLPRRTRQMLGKMARARALVEHREGRAANTAEIANEMGMSLRDYQGLMADSAFVMVNDIEAFDVSDASDDPVTSLAKKRFNEAFEVQLAALPGQQRDVMELYYDRDLNFREIANVLGFTESRASQIHSEAVRRLRRELATVLP